MSSGPPAGDCTLCGWRVTSDLPLATLPPWRGDDRPPDVTIRGGELPARLVDVCADGPIFHVAADGTCRYEIAAVAAFLIRGGREIVVAARAGVAGRDVETFLFGPVLAILCYQRGLIPLHASCIEIDGQAVAIAGTAGVGKSTLAAAALRAGHRVLSDDVTVLSSEGSRVRAWPTVPRLALWPDVLRATGIAPAGLEPRRTGVTRLSIPLGDAFCDQSRGLAAILYLAQTTDSRFSEVRALRGADALAWLHDHLHTAAYPARLHDGQALFQRLLPMVSGIAWQRVMVWERSLSALDGLFADVRAALARPEA